MTRPSLLLRLAFLVVGTTADAQAGSPLPGLEIREAALIGSAGEAIGSVLVRGSANATVFRITVRPGGLAPGWHGVRLHAVGDCSDPGSFQRARGPIDHVVRSHGLLHPEGPEESNLPNIHAGPDGSANAEMSSLVIRMLGSTGIVEGDGTALVVHAGEDDHASQPDGSMGPRIACAVLR